MDKIIQPTSITIVTGANSGIGFDLTSRLLAQQSKVIAIDLELTQLGSLCDAYRDSIITIAHDLRDNQYLESLLKEAVEQFGSITGIAHVAGIPSPIPLKSLTRKTLDNVFSVNVLSAFDLFKASTKKGIYSSDGLSVVFVSSVYSLVGAVANSAYAASKAALNGAARSLAIEYAQKNIRVNVVAPGFVRTEMFNKIEKSFGQGYIESITSNHPLGLGVPEDVSNSIIFLLSPYSRWITGTVLTVDGGYSAQ